MCDSAKGPTEQETISEQEEHGGPQRPELNLNTRKYKRRTTTEIKFFPVKIMVLTEV